MQRVIVNMRSFVFSEAIERALRSDGDFRVIVVERPEEVAGKCRLLAANALLLEVADRSPWRPEERIAIRDEVKRIDPDCKIVLLVDENTAKTVAEQVKQAKRDGRIDLFVYGSTSTSYLSALMETL